MLEYREELQRLKEGQASPNQVSIADDADVEGLKKITEVIHKNGVPVLAQLAHAGSAAKEAITGLQPVSASAALNPCNTSARMGQQVLPKEMDQEETDRIIRCFADAAARAKKAGYDGVEIHSAHGYLLDQFYMKAPESREQRAALLKAACVISSAKRMTGLWHSFWWNFLQPHRTDI